MTASLIPTLIQSDDAGARAYLFPGDVREWYSSWPTPDVIISDGAYGVDGFEGDPSHPDDLPDWYAEHIRAWSRAARPGALLWFWNSEIGWALVHPLLAAHGWDYIRLNIWNKGRQHLAGRVWRFRVGFPVVTEACALYVRRFEVERNGQRMGLQDWLRAEWDRSGLPRRLANEACQVRSAATRKYLTRDQAWYAPSPEAFDRLSAYANAYGDPAGRPYFSLDGVRPLSIDDYRRITPYFKECFGVTNVWDAPSPRGNERIVMRNGEGATHPNQKPLALIRLLVESSSQPGDVIWEPFGGMCPASAAALQTGRQAWCAERDPVVYAAAVKRLQSIAGERVDDVTGATLRQLRFTT